MSRPWVRCGAGRWGPAVPEEGRFALLWTRNARLSTSVSPPREGDAARREQEVSDDESVQPPNMDPVNDALERLEWQDARERGDAALAAEGAHPAHRADRRRRGPRHRDPDRVRRRRQQQQQQRDDLDGQGADQRRRHAGGGHLQGVEEVQVRLRQPRDDEPVLRPDALRRRGRLQAAGLQLPVDRLGELERQRDGQRVQHRHHRRRRRHRGRASSTRRRSTGPPTRR